MEKIINTEKNLIKLWIKEEEVEESAMQQIKNIANLPFVFKHIAIMPDTHTGFGMPIGGVMATKDVIIPNAVGSDIGCGMCAVKTSLTEIDTVTLKKIMSGIREIIPLGFNKHTLEQDISYMPVDIEHFANADTPVIINEFANARKQIGTLGGGNHFIEIQKGSDGHIWIMIHSGSRNLGKQVCDYYRDLAFTLNNKWYSNTYLIKDKEQSLAFLPVDSIEGQQYLREMQYCVEFALANRKLMMDRIKKVFTDCCLDDGQELPEDDELFEPMINIAHNYASLENHFGENVLVHRKGATLAREGTIGIIPGSQGTSSYIVKGLGNEESFMSCSHGSGRKMSRNKAIKELDLEEEKRKLDEQGIIHAIRGIDDLDEASGSYKDITKVMEYQKDLVKILVELKPLAVIKG